MIRYRLVIFSIKELFYVIVAKNSKIKPFRIDARMKQLLFILTMLFANSVCGQQTNSAGSEIFSKQDAAAMFELSLEDWKMNVIRAKQAGAAEFNTDGDLNYTMNFITPDGQVIFTPSYSRSNTIRPWKLSVSIMFSDLQAIPMQMMTDDELKKAFVEEVYFEMLPEFTVFSSIEIPNVTKVIHSVEIFEAGFDEVMDEQGAKQLGCFKSCVSRAY